MKKKKQREWPKSAYIVILYLKRLVFYAIISFIPNFYMYFIESYMDRRHKMGDASLRYISIFFSLIFFAVFISILYTEKRHIYNIGITDYKKLKEPMKFQTALAFNTIAFFLIISTILAVELRNRAAVISLLIPMYLFYLLFDHIFLSFLLALIVYSSLIFLILVCPYIQLKRSAAKNAVGL